MVAQAGVDVYASGDQAELALQVVAVIVANAFPQRLDELPNLCKCDPFGML